MPRKPPRWLSLAATVLAAVGTTSAVYQTAAEAIDRKRYPPPGRMVDVGDRSLHLVDMGIGSPAVVIIQALGANSLDFLGFYRELAASGMRVIVYDRAGLGWSKAPAPGRRTHNDMAHELHGLLAAAKIAPQYVLAGHSFGGIIARRFAVRYPGDVAGIVLIDSSHEDQVRRFIEAEGPWGNPPLITAWRVLKAAACPLGLRRLLSRRPSRTAVRQDDGAACAVGLTAGPPCRHPRDAALGPPPR